MVQYNHYPLIVHHHPYLLLHLLFLVYCKKVADVEVELELLVEVEDESPGAIPNVALTGHANINYILHFNFLNFISGKLKFNYRINVYIGKTIKISIYQDINHRTKMVSYMERIIGFTSWMTNDKASAASSSTPLSKTKKIQSNTMTPRTAEMGIQVQIKVPTMLAPTPTSAFMPAMALKSKTKHTNTATTATIETQTIQNHELISYTDDEMIGHYTHKVLHTESKPAEPEAAVGEAPASDEPFTCCVCLDTLSLGNPNTTFTSCGHAYHLSCLLSSLSKKNLCPMCRGELEETRPKPIASNVLRPVNAEQIIRDELYWFPKSAYIQNIRGSNHPRRAFKESMRTFAYAVLQSAAEFVHEENVPEEWYSEEDTDDESDDSNSENENENENENSENENESESENENSNSENDNESDNESLHNQQQDEDEFNYAEQLRIRTMGVNPLANRQSRSRLVSLHGSEFDLRDALP